MRLKPLILMCRAEGVRTSREEEITSVKNPSVLKKRGCSRWEVPWFSNDPSVKPHGLLVLSTKPSLMVCNCAGQPQYSTDLIGVDLPHIDQEERALESSQRLGRKAPQRDAV